jgi:hypothetical protein
MGLFRHNGGPIADPLGQITTTAPPTGRKGPPVQRRQLTMTATTKGKDDNLDAPVVTYEAGKAYSVGPDLFDVFVNQLQVAQPAAEPEPAAPAAPAGEPLVPGEVQAPAARETKPAPRAAARDTKPKPKPKPAATKPATKKRS